MIQLFETQRAMRAMRKAAMQRGVMGIVDLGTSKVTCLILRFDSGHMPETEGVGSMAGQAQFRVIGAATTRARGMRHGEIEVMQEAERAVRTVVQTAQKMAQVRIDHAIVSFSGASPRSYGLTGEVELGGREVSEADVAAVLANCDTPDIGLGRAVLHAQPVNFALDYRSGLSDPRGQLGNSLTADMHLLTVDQTVVQNIMHCMRRSDLELAGLASSAYAAGVSAMVEDEQKIGSACIDLGAGTSGLSIFLRGHMIYADTVRIGGMHVTQDISKGLGIPVALAERIKTLHGGLIATGRDDREMIPLTAETGDWEHDRREISRSELIGIMRPRVEEILEAVRDRLDAAGFDDLPSQKIVLTGGGSQVPGLASLAARILGQQVRLGRPLRIQGLPQAATGPAFSSAVGLALFAAHPQDECWDFDIANQRYPARSLRRAVKWFKENW
ncbi:cell division protein FtsA [Meridianimarinicoccus aquatilis]|uniref:Cell division protein FtsA n=1 Tax=Meridianimarinicoccus aquatilis TaxID=2552766 RepID=A0A4R6AU93_9RHOB|nr:cell division protein FtsA [Fluviibacterium aquatile]QIE41691.1 cell division protein FtsA [Rhodobacteraceae bacterium SC52]TDL86298.1 cell division protein FtsA [Fluviibacterium aquatile]